MRASPPYRSPRPFPLQRFRRLRQGRSRRRGSATIEMALVAPFVILLVFGSIEFARMMMVKQALTNAAREGCRQATLATSLESDSCSEDVRESLAGTIKDHLDPEIVRITISPDFEAALDSGVEIVTEIEVDCADVSWLPPMFFAGARIKASSVMHRE